MVPSPPKYAPVFCANRPPPPNTNEPEELLLRIVPELVQWGEPKVAVVIDESPAAMKLSVPALEKLLLPEVSVRNPVLPILTTPPARLLNAPLKRVIVPPGIETIPELL